MLDTNTQTEIRGTGGRFSTHNDGKRILNNLGYMVANDCCVLPDPLPSGWPNTADFQVSRPLAYLWKDGCLELSKTETTCVLMQHYRESLLESLRELPVNEYTTP